VTNPIPASRRVLLVDDDDGILRAYSRALSAHGSSVDLARDGSEALERFGKEPYDVVLSDISMGGMDGLELLRRVRERDLDIPVILMTAAPEVQSAIRAVQYGALRYLTKPIELDELLRCVAEAAQLGQLARLKREALSYAQSRGAAIGDRAGLEVHFRSALEKIWMAFHPIVSSAANRVHAYEALVRSSEPMLPHPGALFDAAERLDRVLELGRVIRRRVAEAIPGAPAEVDIFVNVHPLDLADEDLYAPTAPLAAFAPRVVLEITERASLDGVDDLQRKLRTLRALGYRIAVDDLGAGYAGLTSLAELHPEVVKIDMTLVRDIHLEPTKQRLVKSMVGVCKDMGVAVVVEGVETALEREALLLLGCDLLQGFLFAKPSREFWKPPV
jgi:EAL domain-containing protein (putative c-di-GMP-specific phosphodiesterase class I)